MKKNLCILLLLVVKGNLFAQATNKDVAFYEIGKPVTISLSNKDSQGDWDIKIENPKNIELVEKKSGYIFTYFTFNVLEKTNSIEFIASNNTPEPTVRTFLLKPLSSLKASAQQEIYGDIPALSHSDGFLAKLKTPPEIPITENTNSNSTNIEKTTEIPAEKQEPLNNNTISPNSELLPKTPVINPQPIVSTELGIPENQEKSTLGPAKSPQEIALTQQYISSLIQNKLYDEARNIFNTLIDDPNIEQNWKYLTDIKLSKLNHNYQEIVDKSNTMLTPKLNSPDIEISIRAEQAIALEKLGQINSAEAKLLYLKSYFPENQESYIQLAEFYIRNKNYEKAIQELNYIISAFPAVDILDRVYYQLATCYYKFDGTDGYNLALNYYKKVLGFGIGSPYYNKANQLVSFLEKNLLHYS